MNCRSLNELSKIFSGAFYRVHDVNINHICRVELVEYQLHSSIVYSLVRSLDYSLVNSQDYSLAHNLAHSLDYSVAHSL